MKRISVTLCLALALAVFSYGQPPTKTDRIKGYLAAMEHAGLSGSVLVELEDEKIISEGYGFSDRENKIKNAPNTLFDIGSLTKQFTAAAIMKLEMQRKLSTDDRITKYFGQVPPDKVHITLHDLLRHQSGLISNVGKDFDPISEAEFLNRVFSSKLKFEPGARFSYSNIGYSLLAMVVEKVSGTSYETYLYENLWKPAQMESTGYTRPRFDHQRVAVGYTTDDSIWGKPNEMNWDKDAPYWHLKGNGGILSDTEDLYKWHRCLMKDDVLSAEAKQKMYHPDLRPGESAHSYYAYGWDVSTTERNTTRIWHNGTNHILYADFLRFTDEKVTLIWLSNKYHPDFNSLNVELASLIFLPGYHPEIPITDNAGNRAFTRRIIRTIETSGLEKSKAEFQNRKPSEQLIESMMRLEGFSRIDNNQPDIAMQLFEMNAFVYPKSAKALQGLGEGYMETGNKEKALLFLNQSLAIHPENPFVRDLIKKLEK